MKRILFLLLFLRVYADVASDGFVTGKLENGLTYYIGENHYPEKRASLRLAVKVGSIYEEDDEKGLAHFVEHMVFRGSRHFKDNEVEDYLHSIGALPGADTNAYTGLDSTIYMLELPIEKEEILEKGFLILSDFAFGAALEGNIVEKERSVIMDEFYQSTAPVHYRLRAEEFNALAQGSSYAHHLPIGLQEVIEYAPSEKIRTFYKKWYRSDRMAVIAVGDFDTEKVEKWIRNYFSSASCIEEALFKPNLEISLPKQPITWVHQDEELTMTSFSMTYYFPFVEREPREVIASAFLSQLIQDRFAEFDRQYPQIFLGASSFTGEFLPGYDHFTIGAACFENRLFDAYGAVWQELEKIAKEGFTEKEWEKVKSQYQTTFKTALAQVDQTEHQEYVEKALDHFMYGHLLKEEKPEAWLEEVTLADVEKLLSAHNPSQIAWVTSVSTPSKKVAEEASALSPEKLPSFSLARSMQEKGKWNKEPLFERGKIVQVRENPTQEIYEWILGNGVKVVLKPTKLEKDIVTVYARASGGRAAFPLEDQSSAVYSSTYFAESGFGGLSGQGVREFFSSINLEFNTAIHLANRSFRFRSAKEHISHLFEGVHNLFAYPSFDPKTWETFLAQDKEFLKSQGNDPETAFEDFTNTVNTQDNIFFQPRHPELAKEEVARQIFRRCYGSIQEFTVAIVGDFSKEDIVELVEKYVASLPKKELHPLVSAKIPPYFPQGECIQEFRRGKFPHSRTLLAMPCDFDPYFKKYRAALAANAVLKLLDQRLTGLLRHQLGNTYGISVDYFHPFYPKFDHSVLYIEYTSLPKHARTMGRLIREEIRRLQKMPPSAEEVAGIQEQLISEMKRYELGNGFWISAIFNNLEKIMSLEESLSYEKRIASLTPEDFQRVSQLIFSTPDCTLLSHFPILDLKGDGT